MAQRKVKTEVRELRIIAGRWRSRKLLFDALPGVRPTPDRVRETLFNWLQPWISGSRCLDLFAGSGVLGFEALSRGAESVTFVDQQSAVLARLREQAANLEATNITFTGAKALQWAEMNCKDTDVSRQFDIVFIDPPFNQDMVSAILGAVVACCSRSARIYVEAESVLDEEILPSGWEIEKSKKAGSVFFHLLKRDNLTG